MITREEFVQAMEHEAPHAVKNLLLEALFDSIVDIIEGDANEVSKSDFEPLNPYPYPQFVSPGVVRLLWRFADSACTIEVSNRRENWLASAEIVVVTVETRPLSQHGVVDLSTTYGRKHVRNILRDAARVTVRRLT